MLKSFFQPSSFLSFFNASSLVLFSFALCIIFCTFFSREIVAVCICTGARARSLCDTHTHIHEQQEERLKNIKQRINILLAWISFYSHVLTRRHFSIPMDYTISTEPLWIVAFFAVRHFSHRKYLGISLITK